MTNGLPLDVAAMLELARRHPEELEKLKAALGATDEAISGEQADAPWLPCDRFQRTLALGSLVLTPSGQKGRIVRFDRNSERALVELDEGGTRFLKLNRVELRRGRPRKESYAMV